MSSWAAFSSQVKAARREPRQGRNGVDTSSHASASQRQDDEQRREASSSAHGGRDSSTLTRKPASSLASSSFLDLKAELAGRQGGSDVGNRQRTRRREDGDAFADLTGRRERKLPAHLRPSPHVLERSRKHDGARPDTTRYGSTSSWASTPSSQLEEAARQAAMERKVKLYEQLQRGKTGGLDDERLRDSLIDWDRKEAEQASDSDSEHEAAGAADGDDGDDPLTEYEDDLGRTRRVRRSEVPREARRAQQRAQEEQKVDGDMVTYGPSTAFPVYRPDPAQRAQDAAGYKRGAPEHFDAAHFEKRYRGAGFYQFSQDEAERAQQMQELRAARDATLRERDGRVMETPASGPNASSGNTTATDLGEQRREARRRVVEEKKQALLQRQRALFGIEE